MSDSKRTRAVSYRHRSIVCGAPGVCASSDDRTLVKTTTIEDKKKASEGLQKLPLAI